MIVLRSEFTKLHNFPEHIENNLREKYLLKGFLDSSSKVINVEKVDENEARKILSKIHDKKYVNRVFDLMIKAKEEEKILWLDSDTYISPGTYDAILSCVSIILNSLDHPNSFLLLRPPGHHSGRNGLANTVTQGFCLFNNAALLSFILKEKVNRVTILDIDLHHGNGTEDIILGQKDIIYVSLHGSGIYPGTGLSSFENIYNYPLPFGTTNQEYISTFSRAYEVIENFDPDYLVVSIGFDFHKEDPLSIFNVDFEALKYILERIRKFDIYFVLEGGYNYDVLYQGARVLGSILNVISKY